MQDGFQEILTFHGHKLNIKGISVVELSEDSQTTVTGKNDVFVSWDAKSAILWERPNVSFSYNAFSHFVIHTPKYQC